MKRVVYIFFALLAMQITFVESKLLSCQMTIRPDKTKVEDCLTFCPDECENGICDFTNMDCICKLGFHRNGNKCVPDCVEGDCLCNPGFKRQNDTCVPFCSAGCHEHEECTAPEVCSCVEQYHREADKCRPDCKEDCGRDGLCAAPNKCECRTGYVRRNGNCQPICSIPCEKGSKCMAPDVCMCLLVANGTEPEESVCQRDCLQTLDLFVAELQVSCKSYTMLQFMICAALLVIALLICGMVISTYIQCCYKKKGVYRPRRIPSELIVTYHPEDEVVNVLPCYNTVPRRPAIAPPPTYRLLTPRQKKTKEKLKRKMLDA